MAYSTNGRKPMERASKIAHREIINNPDVTAYLRGCILPAASSTADLTSYCHAVQPSTDSKVRAVIAIDGGFTETPIREEFPSAALTFFTFGPLLFRLDDLRLLDSQRFIAPEDLAKLKRLERHTLILPTRAVRLASESSLVNTIRKTIYEFFTRPKGPHEDPLIKSLAWFLFRRWEDVPDPRREEVLEHCPTPLCTQRRLSFRYGAPTRALC